MRLDSKKVPSSPILKTVQFDEKAMKPSKYDIDDILTDLK